MLVFSKESLVILSVPKTGTTAYHAALAPRASLIVSGPPELKHAPVLRYNRFFRPMLETFICDKPDIMAVVREPISWLGSWYRYRRRDFMKGSPNATHDISFDEFIEAYMHSDRPDYAKVGSQAKFLQPAGNGTAATHVFRYEDQAGILAFLEHRFKTEIILPRCNVSPEMSLELAPDVEARLREKCAVEFALWQSIGSGGAYTPPSKSG